MGAGTVHAVDYFAIPSGGTAEERACYNGLQDKVAWARGDHPSQKKWETLSLERLCAGRRYALISDCPDPRKPLQNAEVS